MASTWCGSRDVMLEYRQQETRRRLRQELEAAELVINDGHFDYGNGYHGRSWVDILGLLERPSLVWRLAENLLDLVPANLRVQAEIVGGVGTAGLILGHVMAGLLDGRRALDQPARRFAVFEPDEHGVMALARPTSTRLRGQRMLLVADLCESDGVLAPCIAIARKAGATVVACAGVVERPGTSRDDHGVLVVTLCDWIRNNGVLAALCPLCRVGDRANLVRRQRATAARVGVRPLARHG